jgi:hypothetical protein
MRPIILSLSLFKLGAFRMRLMTPETATAMVLSRPRLAAQTVMTTTQRSTHLLRRFAATQQTTTVTAAPMTLVLEI